MQPVLTRLGYDNPDLLLTRTSWMSGTFALATVALRFFVPGLNFSSHFVFGQITSLTFNSIFYNDHVDNKLSERPINPGKKDVLLAVHFLAFSLIPVAIGKWVVSGCFEDMTWTQAVKTGLYFAGFGIVSLCAIELCKDV